MEVQEQARSQGSHTPRLRSMRPETACDGTMHVGDSRRDARTDAAARRLVHLETMAENRVRSLSRIALDQVNDCVLEVKV